MLFKKNEIIELSGGKKHLIVDTLQFEGTNYYYVCEVVNDESSIVPNFKVINLEEKSQIDKNKKPSTDGFTGFN